MIRYRLECADGHAFEAWFPNAADFDRQAKRKLVACPACGSVSVSKALMAPGVVKSADKRGKRAASPPPAGPGAVPQQRVANASQREIVGMLRKLRDEVVARSEYVGPRFAEEARKIHHEEAEARGIYGEATPDDVKALAEDGVEVYPLPVLPEDHN